MPTRRPLPSLLLSLALFGCNLDEPVAEEDTSETSDEAPLDGDEDGLTDEDEAALGTDPTQKDTDADSYWDAWEIDEGTDPLDLDSRIYTGSWPYNPDKDELEQGSWETASLEQGAAFPRASFLDQHGDLVDIYDFANFTANPTNDPAYVLIDISAPWCEPCHVVASWLAGDQDASTEALEAAYPTVRAKVQDHRIWWITFIVEQSDLSAPTQADAAAWASLHPNSAVPVLADVEQQLMDAFAPSQFPYFFLVDPELRIAFVPTAAQLQTDPNIVLEFIDQYL